jgi:hypothetical protein
VLVPSEHLITEFYRYLAGAVGLPHDEEWPARPELLKAR